MSAPISYRGWSVTQGCSPEPAWTAVNGEKASAATFNELCQEIDAWFEENGPPSLREIIAAEINVGDRYAIADRILAAMGASDKSDRAGHEQSPQAVSAVPVTIPSAVAFLAECARYFENRPTGGEDRAYWSNVYNAKNCRKIAALLASGTSAGTAETGTGSGQSPQARPDAQTPTSTKDTDR